MRVSSLEVRGCPGALYRGAGFCEFSVWAPAAKSIQLRILSPDERSIPMEPDESGYWTASVDEVSPGTRYRYRIDNDKERPDPASRFQPEGVHGPSEVTDPDSFRWTDEHWRGIALRDAIIYELHVGTFTPDGTFEAVISRLEYLKDLNISAVELMPVAQFPGTRNWGYDGVYPYAPQNSYGGPEGLKTLVNACHEHGISVILDIVYNHLGPDGNYLCDFGPYFTSRYKTPWGDAINFDGPYSDGVRNYVVQNALYWVTEYHVDGLRLDAVDTIYDFGPRHILAELTQAVHRRGKELHREIFVIAESDLNDVKILNPPEAGGYGLDAQWSDDFHHSLHALLTGERTGYYQDFGTISHLAKAFDEGFVYDGEYSVFRKRRHGNSAGNHSCRRLVVCSQNHDQAGNRMLGERLSSLVSFEQLKLAAACVLLSPYIPLLFMGEEYGEGAPFLYFVDHIDERLIQAIRTGRTREFAHFNWQGEVPDPQDEKTYQRSKIDQGRHREGRGRQLFAYYRTLINLRKSLRGLSSLDRGTMETDVRTREQVIILHGLQKGAEILILFSFRNDPLNLSIAVPAGTWSRLMDSSAVEWGGPGAASGGPLVSPGREINLTVNPFSAVLYQRGRNGDD